MDIRKGSAPSNRCLRLLAGLTWIVSFGACVAIMQNAGSRQISIDWFVEFIECWQIADCRPQGNVQVLHQWNVITFDHAITRGSKNPVRNSRIPRFDLINWIWVMVLAGSELWYLNYRRNVTCYPTMGYFIHEQCKSHVRIYMEIGVDGQGIHSNGQWSCLWNDVICNL